MEVRLSFGLTGPCQRGVEKHLWLNRTNTTSIIGWRPINTYLTHLTLFEHIVRRWKNHENASFILQDDTQLKRLWPRRLAAEVQRLGPHWERVLLVWWGSARRRDCSVRSLLFNRRAGPTEDGPECCGKRFFHGLQVRIACSWPRSRAHLCGIANCAILNRDPLSPQRRRHP